MSEYTEYRRSDNPQYDAVVMTYQVKLNAIRQKFGNSWSHIREDGYFGSETEGAVKGFQQARGITPAKGTLGPTTRNYIDQAYNQLPALWPGEGPTIQEAPGGMSISAYRAPTGLWEMTRGNAAAIKPENKPNLFSLVESFLMEFSNFLNREIEYVKAVEKGDPKAFMRNLNNFLLSRNTEMQQFKSKSAGVMAKEAEKAALDSVGNAKLGRHASQIDVFRQRQAQSSASKLEMQLKTGKKQLSDTSKTLVAQLEKMDIVGKINRAIDDQLKKFGIDAKSAQAAQGAKGAAAKPAAKVKAGGKLGGIFKLIAVWPVLQDLTDYRNYGTPEWTLKFQGHVSTLIDQLIIGMVANLIAELAVCLFLGTVLTGGWLAVVVAVVAMVLFGVIAWLFDKYDISFGEWVMAFCTSVVRLPQLS